MKGKSSPKSKNGMVEVDYHENLEEPHLSGAYIRTLVKELTSSRTKDSSSNKVVENSEGELVSSNQNSTGISDGSPNHKQEKSPQQHKKQVRRRLHTSRPYQERLLNMAEARREIVAALKFHRAAMKQASERKHQQHQQFESGSEMQPLGSLPNQLSLEQEAKLMCRRNPRIYVSNSSTSSNFPINLGHSAYSQGLCSPYSWHVSTISPPSLIQENLNFILPSQTLGLNLNLQDFNLLDTPCDGLSKSSSVYSPSSTSTSSSPATEEIPSMVMPPVVAADVTEFGDSGLHPAMDDKEMAEIRSIGEQYQMEWNDTMNLVTSAWWLKFLKEESKPEDEVMEYPAWLNANESCLHDLNDCCSDENLQEPALPCMDIEEIEGMDDDWLA